MPPTPFDPSRHGRLTAVLGPTNTGKTHLAVERLCGHSSGVMGFPLRLLAREIYDRVVAMKGEGQVALITGEERIEPPGARWYLCTAESMPETYGPEGRDFAFVGLDEAQLGTDAERGHVFTDRLLGRRGREETMILGSGALAPVIRKLLPEAEILSRPRFSTLSYGGAKKLSRLPARSAVVAFSVEEVYAVAEMLRRLRGGAAVVMGALSPATRNKQVEMFQSGEVDYLVATDAIGMGLNLDVGHIAFASLRKFDGRRRRRLEISEMAQIAGRAGRHQRDGTFGTVSGGGQDFTPEEIEAIEGHVMPPVETLYWRDPEPRTGSLRHLIADLEARPTHEALLAAPEAIDLAVLKQLADDPEVTGGLTRRNIARLWEVASLPDFRSTGPEHHSRFVARLWRHLAPEGGRIPRRTVAEELARLDSKKVDVDALSGRIAAARTWTYATTRSDWVEARGEMAARARELEEKLSDALHDALRQRFVDRRSSVLFRKMGSMQVAPKVCLDAEGLVLVDDEAIGSMSGFRFDVSPSARGGERKMLLAAAGKYLGGIMEEKAKAVAEAPDAAFAVERAEDGAPLLTCGGDRIGKLVRGQNLLAPRLELDPATADIEAKALAGMRARAEGWIAAEIEKALGGLGALEKQAGEAEMPGELRALGVQLVEAGGAQRRKAMGDLLRGFSRELRAAGRKAGLVFGALDIYHFQALKPRACFWRDLLHGLWHGHEMQQLPSDSAVHLADWNFRDDTAARLAGYARAGSEWLRIDLAERLVRQVHDKRGGEAKVEVSLEYPTSLGLSEAGYAALLSRAGFARVEPPEGALPEAPEVEPEAKAGAKPEEPKREEAGSEEQRTGEAAPAPGTPAESSAEAAPKQAEGAADMATAERASDTPETAASEEAEPEAATSPNDPANRSIWFEWAPRQGRGRGKGRKQQRQTGEKTKERRSGGGKPADRPASKSALAEALGEQLAALKDKN